MRSGSGVARADWWREFLREQQQRRARMIDFEEPNTVHLQLLSSDGAVIDVLADANRVLTKPKP